MSDLEYLAFFGFVVIVIGNCWFQLKYTENNHE